MRTSECIELLGPTGIVLHYARRKVQSSTCIPVGMHTEALAPPKPTGINSTNWTWFGSWQTSVPYRSSTFLGRGTWISRSIAFSPQTMTLSLTKTNIPCLENVIFFRDESRNFFCFSFPFQVKLTTRGPCITDRVTISTKRTNTTVEMREKYRKGLLAKK